MLRHRQNSWASRFGGLLGVVVGGSICNAAFIQLNAPSSSIQSSSSSGQVTARLKFDGGGGVDQMLYRQPSPVGFAANDLIRMNTTYSGSITYGFELTHIASTGEFLFSLTNGMASGGASFSSTAAQAGKTLSQTFDPSTLQYNAIYIYALATNPSTVAFEELQFVASQGLNKLGAVESSGSVTGGTYEQWLAASQGTNLNVFDWTVSGKVTLQMNGTRTNNEALKFEISTKQAQIIPEPAALGALGVVVGVMVLRRRKRA